MSPSGGGSELGPYDYALVRVVPRVERGEIINVGVVLYAKTRGFLGCRLDEPEHIAKKIEVLAPSFDRALLEPHLRALVALCDGDRGAGPVAALSQSERFHWLTTHRSTAIQSSVLHSGICADPRAALDALFAAMVRS